MPPPIPFALPSTLPPTESLFFPSTSPNPINRPPYILFIPGNPGLITYYTTFLETLSTLLPRHPILGVSLSGFHPSQSSARDGEGCSPIHWTLAEQISHKLTLIRYIAQNHGWDRVIITAHSVGAYLELELIRRLQEEEKGSDVEVQVVGGVLLFPTIVDIALSPSGLLLTSLLNHLQTLPSLASTLAQALTKIIPPRALHQIIKVITWQPSDAAAVTRQFIATPGMVYQSLELAREEMVSITHDAWEDRVWESGAQLVLYFAEQDSWVSQETRDAIIKRRGSTAKTLVCKDGVPHGFCVSHGEVMAEKVAVWILELMGE